MNDWQNPHPEPLKDEAYYDIILVTDELIYDVEYWAFGGGFQPNNRLNAFWHKKYVNYPLDKVKLYRLRNEKT